MDFDIRKAFRTIADYQIHTYAEVVSSRAFQHPIGICTNKRCFWVGKWSCIFSKRTYFIGRYYTKLTDKTVCPFCEYALYWRRPWEMLTKDVYLILREAGEQLKSGQKSHIKHLAAFNKEYELYSVRGDPSPTEI